jgi:hypothetical protein
MKAPVNGTEFSICTSNQHFVSLFDSSFLNIITKKKSVKGLKVPCFCHQGNYHYDDESSKHF